MSFFKKIFKGFKKDNEKLAENIRKKNEENSVAKIESNISSYNIGLNSSSKALNSSINSLISKYRKIDESIFEELEEILIASDMGYKMSSIIVESVKEDVKIQGITDSSLIKQIIYDKIFTKYIDESVINTELNFNESKLNCFLVTGVNGVGKTTSIAKIANMFKNMNKKVLVVAADTFRAGAVEQLKVWTERINVDIVTGKPNANPASVIFDGLKKAKEENYDLVLCDTAGRLQNKVHLMNELKKIYEVIKKFIPDGPQESLLVIDSTTGQTGINQAKAFNEVSNISGIVLTKMDGTSKGGIVFAIKEAFNIPVKLIGFGEKVDDLKEFDLELYINGMTSTLNGELNIE